VRLTWDRSLRFRLMDYVFGKPSTPSSWYTARVSDWDKNHMREII